MDYTCKNCGNVFGDHLSVCPSCGAPVEVDYQNTYTYTNPNATYQAGAPVNYGNMGTQPKSKLVAGLLGIFLGGLGVHNFYLGFTGKAVAQLLISLLSCGALAVVSAIWGLIEGILILTGSINRDASGMMLGD